MNKRQKTAKIGKNHGNRKKDPHKCPVEQLCKGRQYKLSSGKKNPVKRLKTAYRGYRQKLTKKNKKKPQFSALNSRT